MKQIKRFVKYTFLLYVCIAVTYWFFVRPVYMNWGATALEMTMKLPEDESTYSNRITSTRAITIQAPKEKV